MGVAIELVTVKVCDLAKLQEKADLLDRLQAAGVDNWEGYHRAFQDEEEED